MVQRCVEAGAKIDPTKDAHNGIQVLQRPNTLVVTATQQNNKVMRYMGEAMKKAYGLTSLDTMVASCRKRLAASQHACPRGPSLCGILRQDLILPRASKVKVASKDLDIHGRNWKVKFFYINSCNSTCEKPPTNLIYMLPCSIR